jgi:hypothetical protein
LYIASGEGVLIGVIDDCIIAPCYADLPSACDIPKPANPKPAA